MSFIIKVVLVCMIALPACTRSTTQPLVSHGLPADDIILVPSGAGGVSLEIPGTFPQLYMRNTIDVVATIGRGGEPPKRASHTYRETGEDPLSLGATFGAAFVDFDYFDVPFAPERVVHAPSSACQMLFASSDVLLDHLSVRPPEFPRYMDAQQREITGLQARGDVRPYRTPLPQQSVAPGERALFFSPCVSLARCAQRTHGCVVRLIWKFPISSSGTVDFSSMQGGHPAVRESDLSTYLQAKYDGTPVAPEYEVAAPPLPTADGGTRAR